jgi:hypothetical protein
MQPRTHDEKHLVLVAEAGVEQSCVTAKRGNDLLQSPDSGLAPSLALGANSNPIDPDLAVVVGAWPMLSASVRRQILELTIPSR